VIYFSAEWGDYGLLKNDSCVWLADLKKKYCV